MLITTSPGQQLAHPDEDRSRPRSFWSMREDEFLLTVVLSNSQLLLHGPRSKKRRSFWHLVSSELTTQFGMAKNKRQCRDRFKLLFQKSITRNQFNVEQAPDSKLEWLLQQCFRTFHLTDTSEIVLAESSPLSASETSGSFTEQQTVTANAQCLPRHYVAKSSVPLIERADVRTDIQQLLCTMMSLQRQMDDLSCRVDMITNLVTPLARKPAGRGSFDSHNDALHG